LAKKKVDLVVICREWQKILRLEDWEIHISTCKYHELTDTDRFAEVVYSIPKKRAIIRILDPDDWDPQDPDFDTTVADPVRKVEFSVIHELIHLHFAPIGEAAEENIHTVHAREQAINMMTSALVNLKYSKQ
jgi:hypothetical protein